MPWNNQNDNNNPWGRKPAPQPDMDEMMRKLKEKLSSLFGNDKKGGGGGGNTPSFQLPDFLGGAIIALLVFFWLISGTYMVAADEEAVVLRFGQYVRTGGPGLNYHLPYPIEAIEKIPVTRIQRIEIGFSTVDESRVRKQERQSLMLTRDENIVDISFIVQFRIKDAGNYLFNIDDGARSVYDVSESAMREVIGHTMIDDVLTTRKAEVESETQNLIQRILDQYNAGIMVVTVKLQDVQPPERVIKEFKDVASAREDKERAKNEAQAYANDIVPKARGEAKKMVLDAQGYQLELVDRAKGEAARFDSLLAAYREHPEVTRKRLYLETMQEVVGKSEKVIVDRGGASSVLPYLPLSREVKP